MPSSPLTTLTTSGVKISVETFYQEEYSRPTEQKYVFAYRIIIENSNSSAICLLRRHWYIQETGGSIKEVEGEGVIGAQPVIQPGESFEYISWTHLLTDFGKMHGDYTMNNMESGKNFTVQIPEFMLVAPFKLN